MKRVLIVIPLLLFAVAGYSQNAQHDFKKLQWLNGTWNRTNVKPGRTATETWLKQSPEKLIGNGLMLKGTDTVFTEKLQLIIKDNSVFYVADVPGNNGLVYFKLTTVTDTSFVCENPAHDFPKKIAYTLTRGKLNATVSGNGKAIDYVFVKQ
jgi:hypothetical protein